MKTDIALRLLSIVILVCAAFACQQIPDDVMENEEMKEVKVNVRSAGEAEIVYPLYLYAFDDEGALAASQVLSDAREEMSLSLSKGDFRIVAVAGTSNAYLLPENPNLEDVISIDGLKGANTPLMMGRANVEITDAVESTVQLTLSYVVAALNVKLKDVPSNVVAVQLALSPLYSTLSMEGKYNGSQKVKVDCSLVSEGIWAADATYIFPGSASETDFSIYFKTDDGIEVTYGYTFEGAPKANYLFNVTGTYAGGIIVGGDFDVTDWEGAIDVEFEFGSDSQPGNEEEDEEDEGFVPEGVPEVGTIWNGTIVAGIGKANETGAELLLMSLDEWDALTSEIPTLIGGYSVNGISSWRLPTHEEATALRARFSGDNRLKLNNLIYEYDEELWGIDGDERYLCTKEGAFYSFKFAGGTSITKAGEKTVYYVRLVKTYRVSLE